MPIRLLVIAEQAVPRAGLRLLIESHAGMVVVGEAGSCGEALEMAARTKPDIIVMDPDHRGGGPLDGLSDVAAAGGARLVLLTGERDDGLSQRALRHGAMGVVFKDQSATTLIKAIERVHAGEAWVDRKLMGRVLAGMSTAAPSDGTLAAPADALTRREREVVALVAEGLRNKQIGNRLYISDTTVRHHLTEIYRKLGVSSRVELLLRVQDQGKFAFRGAHR
jgi:DNA-binding NarL/FixJ family response regulator